MLSRGTYTMLADQIDLAHNTTRMTLITADVEDKRRNEITALNNCCVCTRHSIVYRI